ncbi:glycosyltransferase [Halapricum salinum]|uniref:Glycosyltransferase n=1 Tax=Halapricum salinum TaxID=1457250 RepID=A0A4D6H9A4_9EURY|nr:glycosyltransferase [Halapricum salinum]QCC50370.1 glycosyltransferase [Halapricum salinum]
MAGVAIYLPELTPGGAQRVTVDLANGLAERGHDVALLVSYPGGQLRPEVDDSVAVVELATPAIPGLGIVASIPSLARYLRRERPRILFSAMTYANVVATLAARLSASGTPVAIVEHTTVGMEMGGKRDVTNHLARWIYPLADRVIAVSEGVAESIRERTRVDPDQVVVLPNPVPVETIRQRADGDVIVPWLDDPDLDVVLWVGRFAPEKDLPTLLAAFDRLHDRRPETRLVLAGTGDERERVERLVSERGLGDAVAFPGYVDPAPYMARASVFALSSTYEGLPTVLVEALACGCPVVSTDCPSGPREILGEEEWGRLVPVGDAAALADALAASLDEPPDPDLLRERAENFASDRVLGEYESLIADLTGKADR